MKQGINILETIKGQMIVVAETKGISNEEYVTLRDLFNMVTTEEEQKEFYTELRKRLNK